jgi:hypothetical protein
MSEFSSYLDGSPTPAWLEELRLRAAQRMSDGPTFTNNLSGEAGSIPRTTPETPTAVLGRRPKRDWLAPDKPWRLP